MEETLVLMGVPPPSCHLSPSLPHIEACKAEPDTGPCFGMHQRYFYNSSSMSCQLFKYGGCLGNQNNFGNERECLQRCRTEGEEWNTKTQHLHQYFLAIASLFSVFCFVCILTLFSSKFWKKNWNLELLLGLCQSSVYYPSPTPSSYLCGHLYITWRPKGFLAERPEGKRLLRACQPWRRGLVFSSVTQNKVILPAMMLRCELWKINKRKPWK